MSGDGIDWPELTLPPEEAECLRETYAQGRVILEYGSGGSTFVGASQPGKLIFSVESDRQWAIDLQRRLDLAGLPSPAILYYIDIGPTGDWGRAVDDQNWRNFHRYPTAIWSQPFFRHPDVVLIDGRFRPACFVTACLRARSPITILFDDYVNRPAYHVVERLLAPLETAGRMAKFRIEPQDWPDWVQDFLLELCTKATFATERHFPYKAS